VTERRISQTLTTGTCDARMILYPSPLSPPYGFAQECVHFRDHVIAAPLKRRERDRTIAHYRDFLQQRNANPRSLLTCLSVSELRQNPDCWEHLSCFLSEEQIAFRLMIIRWIRSNNVMTGTSY
jgi:hypothetical protein